jgi:glycosyltransferase involved in cell wall biosynthesis
MRLIFIDGTQGFYPRRLKEKSTGGIITSLTLIPQILAKRGHEVYVLSSCLEEEKYEGVTYMNKYYNVEPDVVIYNRNVINANTLGAFPNAKKIWWLHDIVDYRYLDDGAYREVDSVVALSKYCEDSYSDFYDIPKSKFMIIPNGVDKKVFHSDTKERDRNLFLTVSAPIKGFYPLEFTYQNLRRHNPNVDFRIYSSQSLHDFSDSASTKQAYHEYKKIGIKIEEPVSQEELSNLFRKARALLMPNHYPEICSNILLQAQACGCPVIASNIGSVKEFIEHGKSGLLTHTQPHDMFWWWKDFAKQAVMIQEDDELFKFISRNSVVNVFDWNYIATRWECLIDKLTKKGLKDGC